MNRILVLPIAFLLIAGGACSGSAALTPRPVVSFMIDAPLCSMTLPVVFSIDKVEMGTDTFVVQLRNERLTSRTFETSVGQHVLSARSTVGYVWPEKTVTLGAGAAFTDSLPFYCS